MTLAEHTDPCAKTYSITFEAKLLRQSHSLFVSGQLPIDRDGNVVNGTMAEEATQENIVEAAKGSIEDIVRYDLH